MEQSIDNGVTDNDHLRLADAFREKIVSGLLRWREMKRRRERYHAPVELFGPGRLQIPGAQACLYVSNWDLVHKAGSRSSSSGGRVTLDNNPMVALSSQDVFGLLGGKAELCCQARLTHDVVAVVGHFDLEKVKQAGCQFNM